MPLHSSIVAEGVHEPSGTKWYLIQPIPLEPGKVVYLDMSFNFREALHRIAVTDVETLVQKDAEYGSSWKKRGGIGAFMMLARKWDRLETQMTVPAYSPHPNPKESAEQTQQYDIFTRIEAGIGGTESILETLRDLRRYCLLVESEIERRKYVENFGTQPLKS